MSAAIDATGKVTNRFTIQYPADGIALLVRRLARLADPADVQSAIECSNGEPVDPLPVAGNPVVPVSPNAIWSGWNSELMSGAKSDAGDAAAIAGCLRLRQHLRVAGPGAVFADVESTIILEFPTR